MQFLLPRHLAIFSKPILFIALLGVVSASIERSNLRGNDRALISISPSTNDELATNDLIDNELTTDVSNNCNDDTTFMFWNFADNDCEMVRATVNNQTYHDENGDFLRINCMKANSNRGSYCPSCAMTGVFEKCPTVCEPLRCSQAPVDGNVGGAVCYLLGHDAEDHDTWYKGSTKTCKCNNGQWFDCYDNRDDPTFNYRGIDGRGCEWIRGNVDNSAYQDEDNNYSRSECLDANNDMGMLCPSCEFFDVSIACPSVCA